MAEGEIRTDLIKHSTPSAHTAHNTTQNTWATSSSARPSFCPACPGNSTSQHGTARQQPCRSTACWHLAVNWQPGRCLHFTIPASIPAAPACHSSTDHQLCCRLAVARILLKPSQAARQPGTCPKHTVSPASNHAATARRQHLHLAANCTLASRCLPQHIVIPAASIPAAQHCSLPGGKHLHFAAHWAHCTKSAWQPGRCLPTPPSTQHPLLMPQCHSSTDHKQCCQLAVDCKASLTNIVSPASTPAAPVPQQC